MKRTLPYRELLHDLATKLGLDPAEQLQRNVAAALTVHLNEAYDYAWNIHPWPEALGAEERTITDGVIPWEEEGLPTLEMVKGVYDDNPFLNERARQYCHTIGPLGVYVHDVTGTAWVLYRPLPPKFNSVLWVSSQSYAVDDAVLALDGHCYTCLVANAGTDPTADATKWQQEPVLKVLKAATLYGALAAARDEEGQTQTAQLNLSNRDDRLFAQITVLHNQMGQTLYARLAS